MRVILDTGKCALHGECLVAAPEVFDIRDDEQTAVVLDPEPSEHLRANISDAALMCPVSAIRVEG
ncbi:ferredoxin [Mycolicibacterium mucogenicum]|uniref:Ferredoxin n=1 Tax=Mycolicibacterium mucogenicum TaxID=56689 RepID=A0A1A3HED0_MYCMU|nr:ferredoxin [Mycolicibacterium mucogenicum]OBJ46440.1 ferredoxin [Mycolicibacterium mucogenicum]